MKRSKTRLKDSSLKNNRVCYNANVEVCGISCENYSDSLAITYDNNNIRLLDTLHTLEVNSNSLVTSVNFPNENLVCNYVLNAEAKCFISHTKGYEIESHPGSINIIASGSSNENTSSSPSLYPTESGRNEIRHNVVSHNTLSENPYVILRDMRLKNINKIIIGHLNVNSIRNKIEMVSDIIRGNIDIFLISESKLDNTFPTTQFEVPGYHLPYRKDRSGHAGGLLLYVRKDIPSKSLHLICDTDIECIMIEINIYKKKWLILGIYNAKGSQIVNFLNIISKNLCYYFSLYDNVIILGDFNAEITIDTMAEFSEIYNLKSLIKEPTCFKSLDNPSCIDLILTNRYNSFQNTKVLETGISDFHKLTVSVMKVTFKKYPPKIITYRKYKTFCQTKFRNELDLSLSDPSLAYASNDMFVNTFMGVFNKHAPIKSKAIRANDNMFMTRELRKAIMIRSKLRNKLNKEKSLSAKIAYNKQRNFCTSLLRRTKREYYSKLNPNDIIDNKKFWKTVKPFFSDKAVSTDSISLIDNNKIYDDDEKVSEIFNDFFSNAVINLNIHSCDLDENIDETDPVTKANMKYKNHESIIKIIESRNVDDSFTFHYVENKTVENEIYSLNRSKACPSNSIPAHIIQENYDIFVPRITSDFNNSIIHGIFPRNLKNADISPVFKKEDRLNKCNYRPVSILPPLSKVFERLMFSQINNYMNSKLSMHLCGFRKNMSAQNCLLVMLEKFRYCLDNKGSCGVLLTDLSKAFDCLNHELLIAKLSSYGFDYNSLKLINNYITGRTQRVRVNSKYSSWKDIIFGVPQGSILGPLLFNIYLNDLFMFCGNSNLANYADDNSPYSCNKTIEQVISQLERDSVFLLNWVSQNGLKANPDKFHLVLSDSSVNYSLKIEEIFIQNSTNKKLLGVNIDNKFSFDKHVELLCMKASQKLHALSRISRYMDVKRRQCIMKAFIISQFGYCPLVWMFHSRKMNNRINKIHEISLRIVYKDNASTFRELLQKDNSVSIHERNIQNLAIELYKVINGFSTELMSIIFPLKENMLYCSKNKFKTRNVHTVKYGTETLAYLGPKIWALVPDEIKSENSVIGFKRKIKNWTPTGCPCKLCKTYVAGVGYID